MDLAVLSGLLAAFISSAGLIFAVYTVRRMNNKLEVFEKLAASVGGLLRYEESPEGEPMIDARLGKMISVLGSTMAKSLKMSMLGALSGPARLEKGLKGAIANDIVDKQMPLIKLAGDIFGINTEKYISKHPEALLQLAQRFAPQLSQLTNPQGNNGMGQGM